MSTVEHALRQTTERLRLSRLSPHGMRHWAASAMLSALFPTPNFGPPAGKGGEPKKDEKKEKS